MKRAEFIAAYFLLAGLILISAFGCAAPANLIANTDFEQPDEYDATRPLGWNRLQSNTSNMFIDKTVSHSGKQCLTIISDPSVGSAWATKYIFNLDKGREYRFSICTKWNGVGQGCEVRICALPYLTHWGWVRVGKTLVSKVYANKEWEKHEETFTMPDGMAILGISFNPVPWDTANSRIWVDDVSLRPLGKTSPAAAAAATIPVYAKRPRVEIDKDSQALLLDGKPFLPIGIAHPDTKEGVKAIKEQGFNTVWLTQDQIHLIDDVRAEGLFAFFDFSALTYTREWGEIARQLSVHKEDPAVLLWKPMDEPKAGEMGAVRKSCQLIRRMDPTRPIAINAANPSTFSALEDMVDILMSCSYPIKKGSAILTQDTDWMDQAALAVEHRKPIWWWIQAYGWEGDGRVLPTVRQERCMTYLSVIHGVKGIFFFSYKGMFSSYRQTKEQPDLWNSFKGLTAELRQLTPVILAPAPKQELRVLPLDSKVHWLLKEYQGRKYIFAANPESTEAKASFTVPGLKAFKLSVLFESGEAPAVIGDSFSDTFEAYGVRIYELAPQD